MFALRESYIVLEEGNLILLSAVLINSKAQASHFSFGLEISPRLYETDLLSRYRAYAKEMICPQHDIQILVQRSGIGN